MAFNIRKICTYVEETRIEGGKVGDKPEIGRAHV